VPVTDTAKLAFTAFCNQQILRGPARLGTFGTCAYSSRTQPQLATLGRSLTEIKRCTASSQPAATLCPAIR
jgi:hypothetical protein